MDFSVPAGDSSSVRLGVFMARDSQGIESAAFYCACPAIARRALSATTRQAAPASGARRGQATDASPSMS